MPDMPVIYKIVAKMIVHRISGALAHALHPRQYGFLPRRQIHDNISNALIAIEYAKYTQQDVLIMQVDVAKAFDMVHWDFISLIMSKMGFGPKLVHIIYWLYLESTSQCILGNRLSQAWKLTRSVRQGCPLSALLYAIATHPLLLHMDFLTTQGHIHGLSIPGSTPFIAQAYVDDSYFMIKNTQQDLRILMDPFALFGNAAGLMVNFEKSKLIPLKSYDWHALLWPGDIVQCHEVVHHLGYPIG